MEGLLLVIISIVAVIILSVRSQSSSGSSSSGRTASSLMVQRNMGSYGAKVTLDVAEQGNPGLKQIDKLISPMFPGPGRK